MACDARTGSTLLCDALARTGVVGLPGEHLNCGAMSRAVAVLGVPVPARGARMRSARDRVLLRRNWYQIDEFDPATFGLYLDEVVRRRTTPNGVFSLKLQWAQLEHARNRLGFDPSALPQPVYWIHLDRVDVVAQAVSLVRMAQTGVINTRTDADAISERARYDDRLMQSAYLRARRAVVKWNAFFGDHGIVPIRVTYEQLVADYPGTVGRVLSDLGLAGVPVPPAELARQADDTSREWAARFRAAHPELVRDMADTTQGPIVDVRREPSRPRPAPNRNAAVRNQ